MTAADEPAPPNHFLIRIEDGQVTGPLTRAEFTKLTAVVESQLRWDRPLTAADKFHRFVAIVIACTSLLFLAIATSIVIWFRNYRLRRSSNQIDGALASNA